jgi:CRP-like cAMP-binding protein
MRQNGVCLLYPANSVIVRYDDDVSDFYYITRGRVRYLLVNEDAEEKVMFILNAGSFFGLVPIVEKIAAEVDIIAEIPTELYKIDQITFYAPVQGNRAF